MTEQVSRPAPLVIGLGELLWDVFPDERRPGGAPANVAFQARQLGCRAAVVTRVGDDEEGSALIEYLRSKGLDTQFVQRDDRHPTGRVTVEVSDEGQPSFTIHENVAWDAISLTDDLREIATAASAVCFGTLAQRSETSRETIHGFLEATSPDCLRVYDVNLRQHYYDAEWVNRSFKAASVVKLNDDEVTLLAKLLDLPQDAAEFARSLQADWDVRIVCVTRGAKGCLVAGEEGLHDIEGVRTQVVDTVGAGDAFTAGLIATQLEGWSVADSARFANRVGALVASRAGAMPPLVDEFAALKAEWQ